jgi:TldD protein
MKKLLIIALMFTAFGMSRLNAEEAVFRAMQTEIKRSMNELKKQEFPPYFISYNITDVEVTAIVASFGKILSSGENKSRVLDIDLRVGDYDFDNTHIIRGNPFNFGSSGGAIALPLETDEEAIRNMIWFATDRRFKNAIERYEKAITNKAVKVAEEDSSADFSREKPVLYTGKRLGFTVDTVKWSNAARELSGMFNAHPLIFGASVRFNTEIKHKYYVNTEGSKMNWSETSARIFVNAYTKADDGMTLPLYRSYFAFTPEELPSKEQIAKDIEDMIELLNDLRNAPMAETFTGPAILSGEAAGVFFHEIFGHRVEGHREKDPNSSQTFKKSIGRKILPEFIDVVFDPTKSSLNGTPLSGYYKYDDEGVTAEKVVTVKDGVFSNFLMSRSPIEGFSHSNGHGRRQQGFQVVSRQSNMIVTSTQTVSNDDLRKNLREEIKKQNKDYGLLFVEVSGGFTFTSRTIPNAFNVTPLVVYKVYADGRADELVRGVDLIGTPLTTFSNIIATGDDMGIFNGICGAESGGVPVSACSPSLLVSTIEVQKKSKSQAKPPILDSPVLTNKAN